MPPLPLSLCHRIPAPSPLKSRTHTCARQCLFLFTQQGHLAMNNRSSNRRSFLQRALGLSAGFVAGPALFADEATRRGPDSGSARPILDLARSGNAPARNVPVSTPDVRDLPSTLENGVKVFHLIAEPV